MMQVKNMDGEKSRKGSVVVRFEDVFFSYTRDPVLNNVGFHVHENEFVALVGPNGSGKSTILKLLLGLERPSSGSISLFGQSVRSGLSHVGYIPQHADYDPSFPVSVREVVTMGLLQPFSRRPFSKQKRSEETVAVSEALELVEIADLASRPYSALSGGQRRRVLVARALASQPQLLILDEPTANMDAESESRLFRTLGQLKGNTTIIIVTHDSGFVSGLTDVVLCVGNDAGAGGGRTVVRHRTEPAAGVASTLYGGNALQVRHDEALPDTCCCWDKKI